MLQSIYMDLETIEINPEEPSHNLSMKEYYKQQNKKIVNMR